MPRNGSGTYTLPQSPFVAGTTISSSAVNSDFSDIASALTASLPRDGQVGMSGALKAPDGSVTAPTLSFNNETNTGFFRSGAGEISVAILGALAGTITAAGFSGSAVIPVGAVSDFAGSAAPAKWLLCFGQNVSRTTYAQLFGVIGTGYGAGDGVTTFGLPDLRGRVVAGTDDMGGVPSGRLTGYGPTSLGGVGGGSNIQLITANLPAYSPSGSVSITITDPGHNHTLNPPNGVINYTGAAAGGGGTIAGVTASHNTSNASTGITASGTLSGNAQGGSSTAFTNVQPTLILNKIIYAGV